MRIAIISDIHGNLEALSSVIENIRSQNIDKIICLGDVVGYGVNPNECIDLAVSCCDYCIKGNHDTAVFDDKVKASFNDYASFAIDWTRNNLSKESAALMNNFIMSKTEPDLDFTAVHATPYRPHFWYYISSIDTALFNFSHFKTKFCFVGHTHVPGIITFQAETSDLCVPQPKSFNYESDFAQNTRFIVNVGSVGQPRDKNPKSCYVIMDTNSKEISFVRVSYDIGLYQRKMLSEKMPEFLIERVADGY